MMIKTQNDQNDHKDHVRVKGIIIIKGVGPGCFGKSSSPLFGGNCPQVNLSCVCVYVCYYVFVIMVMIITVW